MNRSEYIKKYTADNIEKVKSKRREWYLANKGRLVAKSRLYYKEKGFEARRKRNGTEIYYNKHRDWNNNSLKSIRMEKIIKANMVAATLEGK